MKGVGCDVRIGKTACKKPITVGCAVRRTRNLRTPDRRDSIINNGKRRLL